MNYYLTSDLHIGHANIIKYSKRPYSSIEEMNEALIKNWNTVVRPGDTVFNLGDFAFMPYKDFKNVLRRLNGKIELILGNHDQMIIDHWDELLDEGLLNSIQYYREFKMNKQLFILFHCGMRVWRNSHHGSILAYGHSHGSLPPFGKSVDVGVDCKEITSEYRPVSLDEVLQYMKNRQGETVDHHEMEM